MGAPGEERTSTLEVRIPKATTDGAKLRVKPPGADVSVVLLVRVEPHPVLERVEGSELDLRVEVPLTVSEAVLGASVRVPTIDGSALLTVPAGTSSGRKLRLRGQGLESEEGKRGDLYAQFRVVSPEPGSVTDAEREALEALGRRQGSPRVGPGWPT
jgi:DnaJ-class molecular chaperone